MSARLRAVARENQTIVADGGYRSPSGIWRDLSGGIAAARDATRLYGPEPVPVPDGPRAASTTVAVTAESTTAAVLRLAAQEGGPVAALNFASARNPGGGYLNGAQAQEEAVCRATALHTCLLRVPAYYAHHREHRDPLYSDRVIFSPGVPVFRDDRGTLLEHPRTAGFLTSPAPNAGVLRRADPVRAAAEVGPALARRAERVVECAAAQGCGGWSSEPGAAVSSRTTRPRWPPPSGGCSPHLARASRTPSTPSFSPSWTGRGTRPPGRPSRPSSPRDGSEGAAPRHQAATANRAAPAAAAPPG